MSPSATPLRHTLARLLLGAAAAACLALACSQNKTGAILDPTGERILPSNGALSGRVDFGDGTFPATLVMIARVSDCSSIFSSVQVIGTFTGWSETASPLLTRLAPCVWLDTLSLPAERIIWKFRTNGDWDPTPDYGSPGSQVDGLDGCTINNAPGDDGNMIADVAASSAGTVVAVLDEGLTCSSGGLLGRAYAFVKPGLPGAPGAFTSTTDGRFAFTELAPGTYNVLIRPPGRAPRTIANVVVGETPTDLGTISFATAPTGGITGTVAFDPARFPDLASPPWQPATVWLKQGTTIVTQLQTTRTDRSFSFTGLAAGTYKVVSDANIFKADSVDNISVGTSAVDVGERTLLRENAELATSIHVAGDFNGFVIDPAWEMAQSPVGQWTLVAPASIAAGTYNMKFVTDATFDNPTDYGGDETVTIDVPATNAETRLVGGLGTALRLRFTTAGSYTFRLDERRQTFTVEPTPAPASARKED